MTSERRENVLQVSNDHGDTKSSYGDFRLHHVTPAAFADVCVGVSVTWRTYRTEEIQVWKTWDFWHLEGKSSWHSRHQKTRLLSVIWVSLKTNSMDLPLKSENKLKGLFRQLKPKAASSLLDGAATAFTFPEASHTLAALSAHLGQHVQKRTWRPS